MEIDIEQRKRDLKELQAEPLEMKIQNTMAKIMEFYQRTNGNCYLSCSGGADSMVLYDIITRFVEPIMNWKIKVAFDDTGLEYPCVRATALAIPNVCVVKPEMLFYDVVSKIGYPLISKEVSECIDQARKGLEKKDGTYQYRIDSLLGKRKDKKGNKSLYNKQKYKPLLNAPFRISNLCCNIMKKEPMGKLKEKPIIATMTEESVLRKNAWLKTGCNAFEGKIESKPMSFWTKQDTLEYIKKYNLKVADIYGKVIAVDKNNKEVKEKEKDHWRFSGVQRSGCVFCLYGMTSDTLNNGRNRFEILKKNYPSLFDFCMRGGQFDNEGLWIPTNGLGMAFIIEWCNRTLSKELKNGRKSLYYKGLDLSAYKEQIDNAFEQLAKIENTRKKWLKED